MHASAARLLETIKQSYARFSDENKRREHLDLQYPPLISTFEKATYGLDLDYLEENGFLEIPFEPIDPHLRYDDGYLLERDRKRLHLARIPQN